MSLSTIVQEHFGRKIFAVCRRQIDRAALGRVVDHVHDQAHESINEIFPSPRFAAQASIQKTAIDFRQRHRHTYFEFSARRATKPLLAVHSSTGPDLGEKTTSDRALASDLQIASNCPLTSQF